MRATAGLITCKCTTRPRKEVLSFLCNYRKGEKEITAKPVHYKMVPSIWLLDHIALWQQLEIEVSLFHFTALLMQIILYIGFTYQNSHIKMLWYLNKDALSLLAFGSNLLALVHRGEKRSWIHIIIEIIAVVFSISSYN